MIPIQNPRKSIAGQARAHRSSAASRAQRNWRAVAAKGVNVKKKKDIQLWWYYIAGSI